MSTDITMGIAAISAAISPLVIGVILIDVMLIALNIWLGIALARRAADTWRVLHYLVLVERPRQWADHVDAGLPTRFLDDWSTCGTGSISGSRMTGSVSRT